MSTLTPAAAAALDGPSWLQARRRAAAERFAARSLPTTDEEIWRYSRIGELDLTAFSPASASAASARLLADFAAIAGPRAGLVILANGRIVHTELDDGYAAKGVRLGRLSDLDPEGALLGAVAGEELDAFADVNEAFSDPVLLHVPRAVVVTEPVVVVDWTDAEAGAVFPRLVVRVEAGADAKVVHLQRSADVGAFVAPVVELAAAADARLAFVGVQELGPKVWSLGSIVAEGGQQAHVSVCSAAFGGDFARMRTDCRLVGRGATGELASLYFADGDQMLDFRTFQDHRAPDCTSDLLFKGVIDDRAHSVYSGLIRVRPEARGTNAFQTNRNIKLSDEAWAESVPNLEIENNDVKCSHASTVGPIDVDQRFYLESRGVPTRAAERLIVTGFFDEVLERLPVPALVPELRERIAEKLEQLGGAE